MSRKSKNKNPSVYKFKANDNIGVADAENDSRFLSEAFIDSGILDVMRKVDDPQSIIVGRTGAGKTALIKQLVEEEERVSNLELDMISLNFVANNNVLNFFSDLGVDLDLFYRLLWRHVLVVEVLKLRYNYDSIQTDKNLGFFASIWEAFKHPSKRESMDYLQEYSESYWQDTNTNIKEVTTKVVDDLNTSLDGKISAGNHAFISAKIGDTKQLSEEVRAEIKSIGQKVINDVQLRKLKHIFEDINENILDDDQKRYYITIDKLDESWVGEEVKYDLIAALLESVNTFNSSIDNAKVLIALREDLVDRVFYKIDKPGYQMEKFDSRKLKIKWSEKDLTSLADKRVQTLVREQYTNQAVHLIDILPVNMGGKNKEDSLKYILARTWLRPRDLITFVNECIEEAIGTTALSKTDIVRAEERYSEKRLVAFRDEWKSDYPNLRRQILYLKHFPREFTYSDIKDVFYNRVYDDLVKPNEFLESDRLRQKFEDSFTKDDRFGMFAEYARVLQNIGVLGVKPEITSTVHWSYLGYYAREIDEHNTLQIHSGFWKVLGTKL